MNLELIRAKFTWGKLVLFLSVLFLLVNILILDIQVFTKKEGETITPISGEIQPEATPAPSPLTETDICPAACLEAITESTTGGITQATPVPTPVFSLAVKEIYIPLGTGSTTSQNWTEISGMEAVIDMANYPNVKSIIFEASLRIPTANGVVHAKLYNVTEQHDVWYSEVSSEGPVSSRMESGNITFASGRKLYRVMMKSTMSYEAIIDLARIKIILK